MGGRGRPVWKNRKIFPLAAKELDTETGYYYFGARYYDPKVSVWISTDPAIGKYLPTADQLFFPEDKFDFRSMPGIGGVYNSVNLNVYHYAGQNPIKLTDPDGNIAIAPAVPLILEGLKWTVGAILGLAGVYQAAISKDDANTKSVVIPEQGVKNDRSGKNAIRIHLQTGGDTLAETGLIVNDEKKGVTKRQANMGITGILMQVQRKNPKMARDRSFRKAIIKFSKKINTLDRGVATAGNDKALRTEFEYKGKRYRFDLNNVKGHNLKE